MDTLTSLQLCKHIHHKLRCIIYSDTFLSEIALHFWAIWSTAACLLHQTTQVSLPCALVSLGRHDLSLVYHCPFLGPQLIDSDHCRQGTPHKSCSFGDGVTQTPSHHNLALFKLVKFVKDFLFLTHQLRGQNFHFLTYRPAKRFHDEELISVINYTCLWSECYA